MSLTAPLISNGHQVHAAALVLAAGGNFAFPKPALPDGVKAKLDLITSWGSGFAFWAITIVAVISIGLVALSKLAHHRMAGVFGISGLIACALAALLYAIAPGILNALVA